MRSSELKADEISSLKAWAEAFCLISLTLVISLFFFSKDPFGYQSGFYWLVLAPLLIALRYGFTKGLVSILGLFAAELMIINLQLVTFTGGMPFKSMFGYLVLVMIAGDFRDRWEKINREQYRQLKYLQQRYETFTSHYQLLKTSHDRLEQMAAGHAVSLRESMQAVKASIEQLEENTLVNAAQSILAIFVEYGGIQTAGLYPVENNSIQSRALASTGPIKAIDYSDPLVKATLEERVVMSVKNIAQQDHSSQYHLSIPLTDANNRIYAILLVEQIRFFSLNSSTFTLLAVIANQVGNLLKDVTFEPSTIHEEAAAFNAQIYKAQRDSAHYKVPAQLVKIRTSEYTELADRVFNYLQATKRGLDLYFYDASERSLLMLLPITDEQDQGRFIDRVNNWSKEVLGKSLEEIGIYLEKQVSLPTDSNTIEGIIING